jgi:hypothetical protein
MKVRPFCRRQKKHLDRSGGLAYIRLKLGVKTGRVIRRDSRFCIFTARQNVVSVAGVKKFLRGLANFIFLVAEK